MTDLRPYQDQAVDAIEQSSNPCLVAPTGSGKTLIASAIIERNQNQHVLFLAHRRELIFQTRDHLAEFGVRAGVILAGQPMDMMRRVQVATVQTFNARFIRGNRDLPPVGVIFIDEAHHAPANTYRSILAVYPDAKVIGMSATPCRRDGRGLGSIFDTLVECPQIEELIALGFLVPTKVFAPYALNLNLKGVKTRSGDYAEEQLADLMDHNVLIGDIVSHWHKHNPERRPTVVFATNVAHSIHIRDEFIKSGVKAAHIDGSTPEDERDEILAQLERGELEVVTNCMVLTEGWDMPRVSCCILARPTKSQGLYRQTVGRVLRPYPGKDHALVLDHAGNTLRHGRVEDPITWTLDPDVRAQNKKHDARGAGAAAALLTCTQCNAIRTAGQPCPECGFLPQRQGEAQHYHDGELAELGRNGRRKANVFTLEQKREWHGMIAAIAAEKNWNPKAADCKFKEKFGHWPERGVRVIPLPPSPEVRAWVRSRQIAFAKSQGRRF